MRVKLPSLTSGSERVPRRGEGVDKSLTAHSSPFRGRLEGAVCYMQLAVPKVVRIAVSTVITMLRILPQVELLLKVPIVF